MIPGRTTLSQAAQVFGMILCMLNDRSSLAEVACLKKAIEDCYGPFGLEVQDRGYLYVPFKGPR
jgi:hypothetical protein